MKKLILILACGIAFSAKSQDLEKEKQLVKDSIQLLDLAWQGLDKQKETFLLKGDIAKAAMRNQQLKFLEENLNRLRISRDSLNIKIYRWKNKK